MKINKVVKELQAHFKQHENLADAKIMKRYIRNQFEFYGLKKPRIKALAKEFWASREVPTEEELELLVFALWKTTHRELHHHALDLLYARIKKLSKSWIKVFEKLVVLNSWWDTVGYLAPRLIGTFMQRFPELQKSYPQKWIASDNIWLQRTAIIFQLKYREATDTDLLLENIEKTASSKEFFIQKGSGWALREYSKTDAKLVQKFVKKHEASLSNFTKREALKWLKNRKKA
ncbi:MAG: DNA alkylation repair protein [Aureispira sp.]|nr:DNA alkylation repair protein [Aureispira sp.]